MSAIRFCLSLLVVIAAARTLHAGSPFIEVTVGEKHLQGHVAARGPVHFWLMGQDGRLARVANDEVKKFRQLSPQFNSWSPSLLRDQLQRELGTSFHVVTTRHYVVCAVGEKKASEFGQIFEEFFRSFRAYFSARGFKIDEPEFPLVAIVFPDRESYARYATAEGVSLTKAMAYYQPTTNRIALYEDSSRAAEQSRIDIPRGLLPLSAPVDGERLLA